MSISLATSNFTIWVKWLFLCKIIRLLVQETSSSWRDFWVLEKCELIYKSSIISSWSSSSEVSHLWNSLPAHQSVLQVQVPTSTPPCIWCFQGRAWKSLSLVCLRSWNHWYLARNSKSLAAISQPLGNAIERREGNLCRNRLRQCWLDELWANKPLRTWGNMF